MKSVHLIFIMEVMRHVEVVVIGIMTDASGLTPEHTLGCGELLSMATR